MKKSYPLFAAVIFSCCLSLSSIPSFAQLKRTQAWSVSSGENDAEEAVPGGSGTIGSMDLTSSDLELVLDGTKKQLVGLRFTGITIPNGATVNRAYIQFANKGDKAPVAGDVYIKTQDADNAALFTSAAFNISSRAQVSDSVLWPGTTSSTWGTLSVGAAGAEQRTPDIASLIQPVINRAGWMPGNALVVLLTGQGVRNAYSFDGSSGDRNLIPKLVVEYAAPSPAVLPVASFPFGTQSEWKYLDNGTDQGTAWRAPGFVDAGWSSGPGKLGYNDNAVTTLGFGSNANNKYITYYFRKQFNVTNVSALTDSLKLLLLRDDGAIVYINGVEVVRSNMPSGAIDYNTFSSSIVDGADESAYFTYIIPKAGLITGTNTIAVEVHQRDGTSSDLGFDLAIEEYTPPATPVACESIPANHISSFVSVLPSAQPDSLRIPSTHTFQMLLQSGDPYTNPANGVTKSTFDFTGYVPINGSSSNGYLSINHEEGSWPAAGVSMLSINYNPAPKTWNITNNVPVDFGGVAGTGRNCSGTVTPWNTVITCEEILPTSDVNGDGYQDIGWAVEIDPATHSVIDHDGDGQPDKLWGLGRMSHENVVVSADSLTVYEGNDENPGYIFKMVANAPGKLGSGNLYVLKLTGTPDNSSSGTWIQVPNSTPAECNNVRSFATAVGATNFNSVEDVEISPKDGKIYFTSKASSRVYRFSDNGSSVNAFDIFVGNASSLYNINYGTGVAPEQWRDGNDNLTFDDEGNLYVIQDGGRNHIWMVRPCHTAANPQVELFAVTPAGCEPTGMTFSPDYKFMFVSMQHPSSTNATVMRDAAGTPVRFNRESAIVIARKEFLGNTLALPISFLAFDASKTNNNKVMLEWRYTTNEKIARFEVQRMVTGGTFETIKSVEQAAAPGGLILSVVDETPAAGRNFYRVKALQQDGREVFTGTKTVDIAAGNLLQLVNTYPNPTVELFNIVLMSPAAGKAEIKVLDASGTALIQTTKALSIGVNTLTLDTKALPAGLYFVSVSAGSQLLKTRLIKQ
ncbi:DUF839 domain-containing protein [Segetibacter sp. 3557_3]|uniref:alkaline phosphatase PhoX n=1 Tax=Segetibacter sp. 3557_3 TaxID=2547429 RepID=UPI001058BF3F|nr:alkaline phosphatase PhoX [Segetibacter sp. 3557_3]TDH21658.1 DUF839 domain-containing protein [Segetibacter sp. 3557_3]